MSQALVIDDNIKNVNVLTRLLATEGLTALQVTNPANLDTVLDEATDLKVIFLDLEMPGVDGYQVLSHIKADARFEAVPVVAYTVHVSEIKVAHQNGFDSFIGKPVDSDKFPDQLARILSGEGVWETA